MMDTRDFVLLTLKALDGEIQGRTKLQKTVYFLGLLMGCAEDLGYHAHFYGPYSEEVAGAVGWLKAIGAIDVSSASVGSTDRSGFEIRRFDVRLNQPGREYAEARALRCPELWNTLKQKVEIFKEAGDIDYVAMAIAAKTYFLLGARKRGATREQLAALAPQFGWDVTPRQVEQAFTYLERLQLVKTVRG
jgi:hypothetical protein